MSLRASECLKKQVNNNRKKDSLFLAAQLFCCCCYVKREEKSIFKCARAVLHVGRTTYKHTYIHICNIHTYIYAADTKFWYVAAAKIPLLLLHHLLHHHHHRRRASSTSSQKPTAAAAAAPSLPSDDNKSMVACKRALRRADLRWSHEIIIYVREFICGTIE